MKNRKWKMKNEKLASAGESLHMAMAMKNKNEKWQKGKNDK